LIGLNSNNFKFGKSSLQQDPFLYNALGPIDEKNQPHFVLLSAELPTLENFVTTSSKKLYLFQLVS